MNYDSGFIKSAHCTECFDNEGFVKRLVYAPEEGEHEYESFQCESCEKLHRAEGYYGSNQEAVDEAWREFCFEPGRFEYSSEARAHYNNEKYFWDFVVERMDEN